MWTYTMLEARSVRVAPGRYGAILEVRYRLGYSPPPMPDVRLVDEEMRVVQDTHQVGSRFRTGRNIPQRGLFNDTYTILSDSPLPDGFRLEVEQQYKVLRPGQTAAETVQGKNKIEYVNNTGTGTSVMLYIFETGRWRLRARG